MSDSLSATQKRIIINTVGLTATGNFKRVAKSDEMKEAAAKLDSYLKLDDRGNKASRYLANLMSQYYANPPSRDMLPAEFTSLEFLKIKPETDVLYFLIGTCDDRKAEEGLVCAKALREYYEELGFVSENRFVPGFIIDDTTKEFINPVSFIEELETLVQRERDPAFSSCPPVSRQLRMTNCL
jgi:hypothetical protein